MLIIQKYQEKKGFQLLFIFHSSTEHEYKFLLKSSSIKSTQKTFQIRRKT